MTLEELQEYTTKKLRTAFALGKTWWQQADSEYRRENKKAEETEKKFEDLIANTLDAITFELKRAAERTSSAGSAVVMSNEQIAEKSLAAPTVAGAVLSEQQIDDMAFGYAPSGKIGELREFARAILSAAAAQPAQEPVAKQPTNGEPEAHKLARILMGMVAGVEDYTPAEIYRDGYSCSDGDVFVHRAADLLAEQAAEIAELVRHIDNITNIYAAAQATPDIAQMIHYPECWDVIAYPTVDDAMREILAFKCADCQRPTQTAAVQAESLDALLREKIKEAWANFERMGEVCSFEGQSMIYASTLEEIVEAAMSTTGDAAIGEKGNG